MSEQTRPVNISYDKRSATEGEGKIEPVAIEKENTIPTFTEKPETRRLFMDLQQTFIDWNDKPSSSPEFTALKDSLLSKISSAAK